jgi:hypothetical protein
LEAPGIQGPAHGYNTSCSGAPDRTGLTCTTHGPRADTLYGGYEDSLFAQHVLQTVEEHDPEDPYFLFWAPHIVHSPLEVPPEFFAKFAFMEESDKPTHERQTYHAMVDFADEAIGNFTKAIRAKEMWDDIVIVFSADSERCHPRCCRWRCRYRTESAVPPPLLPPPPLLTSWLGVSGADGGPVYHNGTAGCVSPSSASVGAHPLFARSLIICVPRYEFLCDWAMKCHKTLTPDLDCQSAVTGQTTVRTRLT